MTSNQNWKVGKPKNVGNPLKWVYSESEHPGAQSWIGNVVVTLKWNFNIQKGEKKENTSQNLKRMEIERKLELNRPVNL